MIRMMSGVGLLDRVSTDVLSDKVGALVKIGDMKIQSHLQSYGHVMHGEINSQIGEVMDVEITGKIKKGGPRKSWEACIKKDLEQYGLRKKDAYNRKKWQEPIRATQNNSPDCLHKKKTSCPCLMSNLQICDKLYDVRFMLCLIFPYRELLSSLQKLVDDSLE